MAAAVAVRKQDHTATERQDLASRCKDGAQVHHLLAI